MKPLFVLLVLLGLSIPMAPAHAQVYSPRKLTQRIAPQLPPPATNPARPAASPATAPPAPLAPAKSIPAAPAKPVLEDEGAGAQTAHMQPVEPNGAAPGTNAPAIDRVPLLVSFRPVEIDPTESLQFVNVSLTNTVAKPICRVTLHLNYLDRAGNKVKDWVTRRELEPSVPANGTLEMRQPAYYMPLVTRTVRAEVLEVRFCDGTTWQRGGG